MKIRLNHNSEVLNTSKSSINIDELLEFKNYTFELLIVKVNGTLIKKEEYPSTYIKDGDDVQVIHVFGGG
jgi:sulfur carrier protein